MYKDMMDTIGFVSGGMTRSWVRPCSVSWAASRQTLS